MERVIETMRARKTYVDAYARHALSTPRPNPKGGGGGKKAAATATTAAAAGARWPPPLALGAVPEIDEVEKTHPAHVCVLFRALAHAQVGVVHVVNSV